MKVYLDRTDKPSMSHRQYVERLRTAFESRDDVVVVDRPGAADVLHLNGLNPFGRVNGGKENVPRHVANLLASVRPGANVVVTEHGALQFSKAVDPRLGTFPELQGRRSTDRVKVAGQRALGRTSDVVVAVSDWVRDALVEGGFPATKVSRVYHGVGEEFQDTEPTATEPFVFHLSKYSPQKDPETILEVGRRLSVPLVVAGYQWCERVPDPPDGVEVRGEVSQAELLDLYNRASAFFFPSLYESFGLPIVEAMACATPVVGSDCGSVPEIVGEGGCCHGPKAIEAYVSSLERLVDDAGYRTDLEDRARQRAANFGWSRTASDTIAAYERAMQ